MVNKFNSQQPPTSSPALTVPAPQPVFDPRPLADWAFGEIGGLEARTGKEFQNQKKELQRLEGNLDTALTDIDFLRNENKHLFAVLIAMKNRRRRRVLYFWSFVILFFLSFWGNNVDTGAALYWLPATFSTGIIFLVVRKFVGAARSLIVSFFSLFKARPTPKGAGGAPSKVNKTNKNFKYAVAGTFILLIACLGCAVLLYASSGLIGQSRGGVQLDVSQASPTSQQDDVIQINPSATPFVIVEPTRTMPPAPPTKGPEQVPSPTAAW